MNSMAYCHPSAVVGNNEQLVFEEFRLGGLGRGSLLPLNKSAREFRVTLRTSGNWGGYLLLNIQS